MPTTLQFRRGNTAVTAATTGAPGEITIDTDKHVVVVHDGVTAGGHPSGGVLSGTNAMFSSVTVTTTVPESPAISIGTAYGGYIEYTRLVIESMAPGQYIGLTEYVSTLTNGSHVPFSFGWMGTTYKGYGIVSGTPANTLVASDIVFSQIVWDNDTQGSFQQYDMMVIPLPEMGNLIVGGISGSSVNNFVANSSGVAVTGALTVNGSVVQVGLVSGNNIKTINGTSILGSGDLTISGGGAAVPGTSYIHVLGTGTASQNGTELVDAYTAAKLMTPYGSPLSEFNRVTIVIAPGTYSYDMWQGLSVDTQYIDLVSLTGARDVELSGINVTANDVYLKGLDLGSNPFTIASGLNRLKCENCAGGHQSFGGTLTGFGTTTSGTFTNCIGGDNSFGGYCGTASGIFINCTGLNGCFGDTGFASGTFVDCTAGESSFGSGGLMGGGPSAASGTFINCKGGDASFGGGIGGTASGVFNNCSGGMNSFGQLFSTLSGTFTDCISDVNNTAGNFGGGFGGYGSTVGGTFTRCKGGPSSFGGSGGTASGTFTDCIGKDKSFGSGYSETDLGIASGIFTDCQGGADSFGSYSTVSGTFTRCKGGESSFGGGSTSYLNGTFIDCVGGYNSFGGYNTSSALSALFVGCMGGYASFGAGTNVSGTYINCIGGPSSFGGGVYGSASGIFTNCVGGYNSFGGGYNSIASGTFTNCKGGDWSFGGAGNASGIFTNCVGGDGAFGGPDPVFSGIASGTFTGCVGGIDSFGNATSVGGTGNLTGQLYFCRSTGLIPTKTTPGRTFYCVDSNGTNNQ